MLRISWQTLRSRRGALSGAFVAIWLAVTLAYATGLLMSGALGAPGPGRFAAADAVVRSDPTVRVAGEPVDVVPAPRLPAAAVTRAEAIAGVEHAVGDVSFPAGVWDAAGRLSAERLRGHGWQSAALTPYRLTAGTAPSRPLDVVVDSRLGVGVGETVRVVAPGGDASYRVSGVAGGSADEVALFFAPAVAGTLSGASGVDAIGIVGASSAELRERMGEGVEVLDAEHASTADAGDPTASDREALVAIFGTMAGIAGTVALFVVAGTFALAIAQRRRETAVLRALGATPRQVRRLIAGEALLVSLAATALGVLAGRPLALAIVDLLIDRGVAPEGFALGSSWIPLAAAVGTGLGIAQLAVVAAARRAGRVRPAEALREVAIEHGRPGVFQLLSGVLCLGGGIAMAMIFTGEAALAFSILGGILLASGTAMLGRWLLGLPAAALSLPLRLLGAPGLLASAGLAANRWRTAALATPVVLITMLVGTQGVLQASSQEDTERVTEARVTADQVVVGRDGAPLPADTAGTLARLPGVRAAAGMLPTELFLLGDGLGWDTPWPAAGLPTDSGKALDLDVTDGSLADVHGRAVAISSVVAAEGDLRVGDALRARMADTRAETLRVAAVYDRAAGLGHVVLDHELARRHAATGVDEAVFVAGGSRSVAAYAEAHPGVDALTRDEYLDTLHAANNDQAWGIWMIVGLSVAFAALALLNTAAMATGERRGELATLRLLGGTSWQATRMIVLELAPVMLVALMAGAAIAAVSVIGVPDGVRGIPLVVPVAVTCGLLAGTALLGLAAGAVSARIALRASPVRPD